MRAISAKLYYQSNTDSFLCLVQFARPDGSQFPVLFLMDEDEEDSEIVWSVELYVLGEENGESVWLPGTEEQVTDLWPKAVPLLFLIEKEVYRFLDAPECIGVVEPEEFDENGNPVSYLIAQVYAQ